jgi:hypothetical protein
VFVDAAQDAGEAFTRDEQEVVEAAIGQVNRERQHLRAVRRVVDVDQRTPQHHGATAFQQRAENFQLAHFRHSDPLAFQVPLDHRGWTISPAHEQR